MSAAPLHGEPVTAPCENPHRWLLMLHGLFGRGRNWSGVARRVVGERPDFGVILMDLPEHGRSPQLDAPHTLQSAAEAVASTLARDGRRIESILGHSLGGKVALAYIEHAGHAPHTAFIIDSTPAPIESTGDAAAMLAFLRQSAADFASKPQAVAEMQAAGFDEPIAQWMAMNLVETGGRWTWRFRLEAIESLYRDFQKRDHRPVLVANTMTEFHFLKAVESRIIEPDVARWLESLDHVSLHHVPGGHWLNIDNPDEVTRIILAGLPPR